MAQIFRPPTTQRIYDVCIIGSQLGGALAGALLARRGYRVLHVDHDGLGMGYEDGGYVLPYAPSILPPLRLLPSADAALRELGLAADTLRALEPCAPGLQILLPRHRVDIFHDAPRRLIELKREWPSEANLLEAGLSRLTRLFEATSPFMQSMPPLPPNGFGDRRAVGRAIRFATSVPGSPGFSLREGDAFDGLSDHPFVSALAIAQRFLGYLDGNDVAPLAAARLSGGILHGSFILPGGQLGLREVIRHKIVESRGEVMLDSEAATARQLEVESGKIAAVRLSGSNNAWVARVFIAATDALALKRLLPPEESSGKMAQLLETVHPEWQLLAINLVVKKEALPPALGRNALVLRKAEGSYAVDNAVLVQVAPARRDKGKGATELIPDERVLCAAGFVPADARDRGDEHLAAIGRQIRETVEDAVPFFERHLLRESIPALRAPREHRGSRLLPHPLYLIDLDKTLGVTGLPCRSPYRNLVFASREVIPGLGLEGEFHAGLQASAAAQELLGRKDLLR
ncbi:MAG TPA: NAD(P)-binding protein [Anaeromyxobacteraceae bacterium]|nr:NAD(P)-binding protein [Anaeromyxobacteraceae bacterium]